MKLYSYYRSSAAYRVRIALNLKGLNYEYKAINLLSEEEQGDKYSQINPQKLVPVFEDKGQHLFQSMAILEYLEESYPENSILPDNPIQRAQVRALANIIACDIHPIDNLRVLKYLKNSLDVSTDDNKTWYSHWIIQGFMAFEQYLQNESNGKFCQGETPGLADILLIPQVYNAHRFDVNIDSFPLINSIEKHCLTLPAFIDAMPSNQPDAKS